VVRRGRVCVGWFVGPAACEHRLTVADAPTRKFDAVVVWALDRLSREGVAETVEHIKRLKSHGVEFISYQEPHFRTIGPTGELMIAVAAWIAEQERRRRSERASAAIARLRKQGAGPTGWAGSVWWSGTSWSGKATP
jgi:DNA invertase Pin-like site-specific DNA recombinase